MNRSNAIERAMRINTAKSLLMELSTVGKVATELMKRYDIKLRQAFRYIQEARRTQHMLPIPEKKVVFTVKVPQTLVQRIRDYAKSSGQSISDVTSQALRIYLIQGEHFGQEKSPAEES